LYELRLYPRERILKEFESSLIDPQPLLDASRLCRVRSCQTSLQLHPVRFECFYQLHIVADAFFQECDSLRRAGHGNLKSEQIRAANRALRNSFETRQKSEISRCDSHHDARTFIASVPNIVGPRLLAAWIRTYDAPFFFVARGSVTLHPTIHHATRDRRPT
jgi:hypothetical protein